MVLPGSFRPTAKRERPTVESEGRSAPLAAGRGPLRAIGSCPRPATWTSRSKTSSWRVGRGIQQKDNLELAEELAQALGGAVCASRPVVDQGWLPATRQVGKSGMTVKPRCFLALGISGAPEHVEGMKDSDLIIAVNTDPNAPIFDVAHYGVVADLLDLAARVDARPFKAAKSRRHRRCRPKQNSSASTGRCGWPSSWPRRRFSSRGG